MSPTPNRLHQEIAGHIYLRLGNYVQRRPCKVYSAPFDVRLTRTTKDDKEIITVLPPDVCVVCGTAK